MHGLYSILAIIQIKGYRCDVCGHIWISRDRKTKHLPIACANVKALIGINQKEPNNDFLSFSSLISKSPLYISRISFFFLEFSCSFLYSLLRSGYPDGQYGNEEGCDEKLEE